VIDPSACNISRERQVKRGRPQDDVWWKLVFSTVSQDDIVRGVANAVSHSTSICRAARADEGSASVRGRMSRFTPEGVLER